MAERVFIRALRSGLNPCFPEDGALDRLWGCGAFPRVRPAFPVPDSADNKPAILKVAGARYPPVFFGLNRGVMAETSEQKGV